MKTFRRDKLRRLVEAGKVETVSTYHFDGMFGESRSHKPMPVAIKPADWHDRKEGICYLTDSTDIPVRNLVKLPTNGEHL